MMARETPITHTAARSRVTEEPGIDGGYSSNPKVAAIERQQVDRVAGTGGRRIFDGSPAAIAALRATGANVTIVEGDG